MQDVRFLYPYVMQFPFDEIIAKIVRELETRGWLVPGIEVLFHDFGDTNQRYRRLQEIKGRDFCLKFGRKQQVLPGGQYFDGGAVTGLTIPGMEICVYDDESGPVLYWYPGANWDNDRDGFMGDMYKSGSKSKGQPRLYLVYEGACMCPERSGVTFKASAFISEYASQEGAGDIRGVIDKCAQVHTHDKQRPPLLIHTNRKGTEYDTEGDEPRIFNTAEVMERFRRYLEDVVLKDIMSKTTA